jgi:hypothetical protein
MTLSREGNPVLLSVILVIAVLMNVIVQWYLKLLYHTSMMTFIKMALTKMTFSNALFASHSEIQQNGIK